MVGTPHISTKNIDYLQRAEEEYNPVPLSSLTIQPSSERWRWWHIPEIGRLEKRPTQVPIGERKYNPPTVDLLTSLYGLGSSIGFLVRGAPGQVKIHVGIQESTESQAASSEKRDGNSAVLQSALRSLYPSITTRQAQPKLTSLPLSGLALGIPTVSPPDPVDGAVAIDHLIRSLFEANWACLVLAEPIKESETTSLRKNIVDELRNTEAAQRSLAPETLVKHYSELLEVALSMLTSGLALGMWRTGVYLLGDSQSYHRLASLWRGIFSGDESLPEPLRVWVDSGAAHLAENHILPDVPGRKAPDSSRYKRPWEYQTLLTSAQLAAYIHLPEGETSGFAVSIVPDFDVVSPATPGENTLSLGTVILRGQPTENLYAMHLKDLSKHAFVAGVTGSGKTNTVFHMLQQVDAANVPFLVIEPAKTEYRLLLNNPALAEKLQVFTLGNEQVSPLRLNPFEVVGWPANSVGVHLDLLRSVYATSFGMWTPLPQILEQCLYRIYEDRGWNIVSNDNPRLAGNSDVSGAYPTLTELAAKVEEVIRDLGYEERVTSDMRAALSTRLNSLRAGGKGRMLDVQHSLPMKVLLEKPTVLELESMGDDDDKAFIMGLLFIRLVEYRRAGEAHPDELRHLLVIEEAHRLLTQVGERQEEEGNPRGKAVETFTNLLAEIRAYGQGVIVADQVPVKLAPEVIKNTNLKIAHRVVAIDDRTVLAGSMAMNERQSQSLAILTLGQAAVFSEEDDSPVLVQVPPAKKDKTQAAPTREHVAAHMAAAPGIASYRHLFRPLQTKLDVGVKNGRAWEAARRIVEDPAFQSSFARLILSLIEDPDALENLWPDLLAQVQARRPLAIDEEDLLRCLAMYAANWYAQRRGAQVGWPFQATQQLADRLSTLLAAKTVETESDVETQAIFQAFRQLAFKLHQRQFDPFPACSRICRQTPPVCLYRFPAQDLIAGRNMSQPLEAAVQSAVSGAENGVQQVWERSMDAGYALIEFPNSEWPKESFEAVTAAARRASLCIGQQVLVSELAQASHRVRHWLDQLIMEAKNERQSARARRQRTSTE